MLVDVLIELDAIPVAAEFAVSLPVSVTPLEPLVIVEPIVDDGDPESVELVSLLPESSAPQAISAMPSATQQNVSGVYRYLMSRL